MSYSATVNKQTFIIDTNEDGRSVTLDGLAYAIDWRQIASLATEAKSSGQGGHYSLIIAGQSYEIFARLIPRPGEKDERLYEVFLNGQRFEVNVEDERARLLSGLARAGAGVGEASVRAPMPGLVVNVLVAPGEAVRQDQPVVVLEAMKMENDLSSPISGTVKAVHVQEGQTVDQGQALVVIEAGE